MAKTYSEDEFNAAVERARAESVADTAQQTSANRPTQVTPFGTVRWEHTPGAEAVEGGFRLSAERQGDLDQMVRQLEAAGAPRSQIDASIAAYTKQYGQEFAGTPGSEESWKQITDLTPEAQSALDSQMRLGQQRSGLAESLFGRAGNDISQGINWGGLTQLGTGEQARQQGIDAIFGQAKSRLDPMWNQREEASRTQLLNQGLDPSSQAYKSQMSDLGMQRNDAYQGAMNSAIAGGGQEGQRIFGMNLSGRQQGISEGMQQQYGGLNALNALLSGQQVGMPQMPGFNAAGKADPGNWLGGTTAAYGASAANAQRADQDFTDTMGALGGLVSLPFKYGQ